MSKYALVSIIVPVYKVEEYLDKCVASLVNQTYKNIEIILVDDGSPDNCPSMCDSWKACDSRIEVIHKSNEGLSDARNAGIRMAAGKWLLFVDADDMVPRQFVESLVEASRDEKHLVVSGKIRFESGVPQCAKTEVEPLHCGKDLVGKRGGLYCWGALYNRDLVKTIDLWFDESLRNVEDVVWNSIYLRYISEVIYVDVPYFYRMNPTSITSQCVDIKWQISSWVAARQSIMNWFADKDLTTIQKREVAGVFRHCQNNIFAECVAGNIAYNELHAMETENSAVFDQALIPALERFTRKYFPKFYYGIYTSLIRAKNAIRK